MERRISITQRLSWIQTRWLTGWAVCPPRLRLSCHLHLPPNTGEPKPPAAPVEPRVRAAAPPLSVAPPQVHSTWCTPTTPTRYRPLTFTSTCQGLYTFYICFISVLGVNLLKCKYWKSVLSYWNWRFLCIEQDDSSLLSGLWKQRKKCLKISGNFILKCVQRPFHAKHILLTTAGTRALAKQKIFSWEFEWSNFIAVS